MARKFIDTRFTKISPAEFDVAADRADEVRERDYRGCAGGGLIRFAMTAGVTTHMHYIGGDHPGAVRCNGEC